MDCEWHPDIDSASWDGQDLTFRAVSDVGENEYVISCARLRNVSQRTGPEALSLNLPLLRRALVEMARDARPGQILTLS